jgi:hypothetical protein
MYHSSRIQEIVLHAIQVLKLGVLLFLIDGSGLWVILQDITSGFMPKGKLFQ